MKIIITAVLLIMLFLRCSKDRFPGIGGIYRGQNACYHGNVGTTFSDSISVISAGQNIYINGQSLTLSQTNQGRYFYTDDLTNSATFNNSGDSLYYHDHISAGGGCDFVGKK